MTRLSNYCELAPSAGFVLKFGASWNVDIGTLDYPLRHWTDGATTGFIIRADGTTIAVLTAPTKNNATEKPRLRGTQRLPLIEEAPVSISVVPWPKKVEVSGRCAAPHGLAPVGNSAAARHAIAGFTRLTQLLFPGEGLARSAEEGGYEVSLEADASLGAEAYIISFSADSAEIKASTQAGFVYGLITLGQIQRGARRDIRTYNFPIAGRIEDSPQLRWRGCHLDVARRFYGSEEVSRFIAVMAWNKLNRFHWHLSDDEAWRVEIDAYPDLTRKAAWSGHSLTIPPLLGAGPERTGGYYSKAQVRAIVALAGQWGIEVVPEIDVPGHCYAMLQVIPQLRDPGENGLYYSIQSFPNNCLNPAVEAVYPVLETIFAEMIELFPSRYFHIGADEVPSDAWSSSPKARALNEKRGTSGAAPLQAHFLQQVQAFLTSKGRITGAWEEAAEGGGIEKSHCYLVGWRMVAASQQLAHEGYEVVVAPGQAYYMDMANGPNWDEPGAGWAGWSSPETTYRLDPAEGFSAEEQKRLLGVQGCIWSEPMTDRGVFDRLVFPRLSAIAETGWTAPENKDFARFSALVGLMPNLYNIAQTE